ncbi:DUF4231 domain-containing protein [Candidatus Venteria ishoeyi]|uniref:SMODS and SLOG-associating 2TM effector domain-containing protein n=1 Tax=Candidatus Venteria ishoeyi TaxID=1899563 RepID=A0A1H6F722_9GAMM|nr:DUF4231 domain-containing protein [Candidatus Venteria ishoeyi]MDM8547734.1 DUF4231 domain-containing protein [Candidatus Venteria ishoeyi]SEH04834.1 Uncharacterised protein [Candidatus Venteria ishoeyi]
MSRDKPGAAAKLLADKVAEPGAKIDIRHYIQQRLRYQQHWYERQASKNKRSFMRIQSIIIFLSLLIPMVVVTEPIVTLFLNEWMLAYSQMELPMSWASIATALLSSLIAMLAGMEKLRQPQTHWFNYRANEETLKKEEWMFRLRVGAYANLPLQRAERLLVERVEGVISSDIARFVQNEYNAVEEVLPKKAKAPQLRTNPAKTRSAGHAKQKVEPKILRPATTVRKLRA